MNYVLMSNREGQNQSLLSKSQISPELPGHIKSKDRQNDFVSSNFQCDFLYACENCDGPLVPTALCIVCKRAANRECLHCQKRIVAGTHSSCSTLIFLLVNILKKLVSKLSIRTVFA